MAKKFFATPTCMTNKVEGVSEIEEGPAEREDQIDVLDCGHSEKVRNGQWEDSM